MSWARPGSAGGALGRPWGPWEGGVMQSVCSRKPPYKIHEDLRDSSGKKNDKNYPLQWSNRHAALGTLSGIDPRPFLEISAQDQLRTKGTKKNSRAAVVNMRSAGGRVQEPPSPHLQFRYPHCAPILMPMVLDSSHNLRMIHEGRTIVTILV